MKWWGDEMNWCSDESKSYLKRGEVNWCSDESKSYLKRGEVKWLWASLFGHSKEYKKGLE